jgi:alkaline phosphatase D
LRFTRRNLLQAASAAAIVAAVPVLPGCTKKAGTPPTGPFRHGVASGDPLPDAVILWTRVTQEPAEGGEEIPTGPVAVTWEMAKDFTFATLAATGTAIAEAEHDFTVKVDAKGLEAGTTYYYRFRGVGETSAIGRTKTAPRTATQLRFAVVSCSNYAMGYFHVYASLSERADLDAVIHVGDYIYEYKDGEYGNERRSLPINETVTLADYRARYAQYRTDFDLRELHRQHPFITTWDDHEVADNASKDGAGNHDASEGLYDDRKRAAFRAYAEWMPIRGDLADGKIWRTLRYGNLADLIILDTRHWGKRNQSGDEDPARFDDDRQILGLDQEAWFFDQLKTSQAQWKIVCQQVLMSPLPQYLNTDQWDGYPKARDRIYETIEKNAIKDVVVLTGDIHASFANDLARTPTDPATYDPESGKGSLCVELVTPAVTSEPPSKPENPVALLAENPWMKHVNLEQHGFVLLDLDATRAQGSFFYVKDVESRKSQDALFSKGVLTLTGKSNFHDAAAPEGDRPGTPPLAPETAAPEGTDATEDNPTRTAAVRTRLRTRTLPPKTAATHRHEPFGALRPKRLR